MTEIIVHGNNDEEGKLTYDGTQGTVPMPGGGRITPNAINDPVRREAAFQEVAAEDAGRLAEAVAKVGPHVGGVVLGGNLNQRQG